MDSIELTESEIIEAFADALDIRGYVDDPNAKTVPQLCAMWPKLSETTVRRKVAAAVDGGRMEAVLVLRPNARGQMCEQTAYRLVGNDR